MPPLPSGPRLTRAQELVYRGSFTQENFKKSARIIRRFQVETRVLVMETLPTGAEVGLLTVAEPSENNWTKSEWAEGRAVHLEMARIDLKGRIALASGAPLPVSQQGPPEIEAGCFVELPTDKSGTATAWTVTEPGGPHQWRMSGTDTVDGQLCLKLQGDQQSDDWERPRGDRPAWRRQDTVWLSPQTGIAVRYERVLERRDPASPDSSQRSTVSFHLESGLVYPGQLFRDRQVEINLFRQYSELADACFREPSVESPRRLGALAAKIAYHCDTQPPTPYRAALQVLRDRLESAARGDLPPIPPRKETQPVSVPTTTPVIPIHSPPAMGEEGRVSEAGPRAPDFVANDLTTGEAIRMQLLRGRPVLVLFYHPRSASAAESLHFAQTVSRKTSIHVLGLSVVDDAAAVVKQRNDLDLTFPMMIGTKLRSTFGVEATPKIILIDEIGSIQRTFEGWGQETSTLVREEIERLSHRHDKREK
jgi:peroxiredoxin